MFTFSSEDDDDDARVNDREILRSVCLVFCDLLKTSEEEEDIVFLVFVVLIVVIIICVSRLLVVVVVVVVLVIIRCKSFTYYYKEKSKQKRAGFLKFFSKKRENLEGKKGRENLLFVCALEKFHKRNVIKVPP